MPPPRRRLSDADPRPVFRFAPSPNGRLHLGHAYSALLNADLASRLTGRLLLRIEDIDPARSRPDLVDAILSDLAWLGVTFEAPVRRQSEHMSAYRAALESLIARGLAYPCFCTRGDIRIATAGAMACDPDGSPLYPGTCRALDPEIAAVRSAREPHAWRLDTVRALAVAPGPHGCFKMPSEACLARFPPPEAGGGTLRSRGGEGSDDAGYGAPLSRPSLTRGPPSPTSGGGESMSRTARQIPEPPFTDGAFVVADPARWGDPVIARRDVPTSYHLAVVVDDAAQSVTHVVRGRDLEPATDLHVLLQALLGWPGPRYHHHALILGPDGEKLAKSRGSETLADLRDRGESADAIRVRLGFP